MIGSCLVMFGGFDGDFYNDLNLLDLDGDSKGTIPIKKSTITKKFCKLVNNPQNFDVTFILGFLREQVKIVAFKSLLLYRTLNLELPDKVTID